MSPRRIGSCPSSVCPRLEVSNVNTANWPSLPGTQVNYKISIPASHNPGLYWYHAHLHGIAEQQIMGGLSGGLIIEGILDPFPELAGIRERVLLLKGIQITQGGTVPDDIDPGGDTNRTVNGRTNQVIQIAPGELQFWRIANIGADLYYRLVLEGHTFWEIARDGNRHSKLVEMDEILLPPASRSEVLVRGGVVGEKKLRTLAFNTGPLSIGIEVAVLRAALAAPLVGKWFVFWSVGVRLLTAGLRQILQPEYTANVILGLRSGESLVVRELGFANVALGAVGMFSLAFPTWRLPAALAGGIFYGLAGLNHALREHRIRLKTSPWSLTSSSRPYCSQCVGSRPFRGGLHVACMRLDTRSNAHLDAASLLLAVMLSMAITGWRLDPIGGKLGVAGVSQLRTQNVRESTEIPQERTAWKILK